MYFNMSSEKLMKTMFILIIIICCFVILISFFNLTYTNYKIIEVLEKINSSITSEIFLTETGKTKDWAEAFYTKIESLSDGILNSNNISFLFQLFSIGLISAGVYLLNRSNNIVKKMKSDLTEFQTKIGLVDNQFAKIDTKLSNYQTLFKSYDSNFELLKLNIKKITPMIESRYHVTVFLLNIVLIDQKLFVLIQTENSNKINDINVELRDSISDLEDYYNIYKNSIITSDTLKVLPHYCYNIIDKSQKAEKLKKLHDGYLSDTIMDILNDIKNVEQKNAVV